MRGLSGKSAIVPGASEDEAAAAYPLQRLGEPADVPGAAAFLPSDDPGWVTGQTVVLDGGVTLTGGA